MIIISHKGGFSRIYLLANNLSITRYKSMSEQCPQSAPSHTSYVVLTTKITLSTNQNDGRKPMSGITEVMTIL